MTRRLARGDERAWRWLHDHYFGILHAAAVARGIRPADAADLIQRTYLRVLRHAKHFRDEPGLRSWLCCLLRCEAIDAARRGRRQALLIENVQPREELPAAHRDTGVETLLDALAPAERDLMTRHYLHGWSHAELAAEGGITPKAVESKLARLRKRLRHALESAKPCQQR
jgi:RNA polymerase sigma-70 factor (ECF subfamily)